MSNCQRLLWVLAVLAGAVGTANAQDAGLDRLRALLAPMRSGTSPNVLPFNASGLSPRSDMRGATPVLMDVKHALRDWIEARLSEFDDDHDERVFSAQLNKELQSADLFCEPATEPKKDRCEHDNSDWDSTGFIQPIRLERENRALVVLTDVGIECGGDGSAYAYERQGSTWQRIWGYEQDVADTVPYKPQHITGVHISWPDQKSHERLVLLLGHAGWCTSTWYPVYYRLWRLDPRGLEPKQLVDTAAFAWLGAHDPPIQGTVSANEATVEFTRGSLDVDEHSYQTVRHYEISAEGVKRADPFALSPRNFTEDWLAADWTESSAWAAPRALAALRSWHAKLYAGNLSGEYLGPTQHCRKDPELWQVGIALGKADPSQSTYFVVRWRPPYRFRMEQISAKPRADCDQPDEVADSKRTLFAGWR